MIKTFFIEPGQKPTAEQLLEVEKAKRKPICTDEDAPELSPAMQKAFRCAAAQRNKRRNVQ